MAVNTYSPDEVSLIVAGINLSGFGPDTFIVVEREVDTFSKSVGAGGEVARRKSANKSGTITVTLLQTSDDNTTLSGLALTDEISLSGTFPVIVKDSSGTTVCAAENCWISAYPSVEFAEEIGTREWVLHADNINMLVGGNS